MPKKVTKKVIHDRKVCAEKTHRGENVCDGELVFEDSIGEVRVECGCVCHAEKVTKKTEKEIASISKFQDNPFAKKYKEALESDENPFLSLEDGEWGRMSNKRKIKVLEKEVNKVSKQEELETADYMDLLCENILEHSEEVKSWKRERVGGLVSWLTGRPDLTRGELYISILIGCTIGNILTNL